MSRISLRRTAMAAILMAPWNVPVLPNDIFLEELIGGGDGDCLKPAPDVVGIDPRTGKFATQYVDGPVAFTDPGGDGLVISPTQSPYIDSVFFILATKNSFGQPLPNEITKSGIAYRFPFQDGDENSGRAWNLILKDRNGGVSTPPITIGHFFQENRAVGIHSSMGITYDLDALRMRHGKGKVGHLRTLWGMDDCEGGDVNLYAILSHEPTDVPAILDVRTFHATTGSIDVLEMDIPPYARYLTFATGKNGPDVCDHGTFAQPTIHPSRDPDVLGFRLGFECPATVEVDPGVTSTELTLYLTLTTGPNDSSYGVQGWSYGMVLDGAFIDEAKTFADEKVDAGGNGLNVTVTTSIDLDRNCQTPRLTGIQNLLNLSTNGGSHEIQPVRGLLGTEVVGVVSYATLSGSDFLQPTGTQRIAHIVISAGVPSQVSLRYVSGLKGKGQPVNLVVTYDSNSLTPQSDTCTIEFKNRREIQFVNGDSNADGNYDLSDVVSTLQWLFQGNLTLGCEKAADVDRSGDIDISDAIYGLSFLFLGGPAPQEPFSECGPGGNDSLTCDRHPACS